MPELPDVTVYVECLAAHVRGATLDDVRLASPFLLRTVDPPLSAVKGKTVRELRRVGKRIALGFDDDLWLVIHLMVAGRLHWQSEPSLSSSPNPPRSRSRNSLGEFRFRTGTLVLTEAGTKRRASLHVVRGEAGLHAQDRGGIEPLTADLAAFRAALTRETHTLKRTLTDPRIFSGIGNAYSDEILHRAKLSPLARSTSLDAAESKRLHAAVQSVLVEWTDRLRAEARAHDGWPDKVTAFRPEMAVHGKYRKPCPVCGAEVQHIVYASNETNYCARCQTGGKLLADRSLSRLLKDDWPRDLDELEEIKAARRV